MKRIIIITVMILSVFTSCSLKRAKIPEFTIGSRDKIGILVDVKEYPTHTHMGTTIFNNFTKVYPYDWGIRRHIVDNLEKSLREKGYKYKILDKNRYKTSDLKELIISESGSWVVNPKKEQIYKSLKDDGLKAVIVISDGRHLMQAIYTGFGSSLLEADGYGLFTRSMLGIDNYFAAPSFGADVYILNPLADIESELTTSMPNPYFISLGGTMQTKDIEKKYGFIKPKDFKNLTKEELEPFRRVNIEFLDKLVEDLVSKI
jgi:hypothetical protein